MQMSRRIICGYLNLYRFSNNLALPVCVFVLRTITLSHARMHIYVHTNMHIKRTGTHLYACTHAYYMLANYTKLRRYNYLHISTSQGNKYQELHVYITLNTNKVPASIKWFEWFGQPARHSTLDSFLGKSRNERRPTPAAWQHSGVRPSEVYDSRLAPASYNGATLYFFVLCCSVFNGGTGKYLRHRLMSRELVLLEK